MVPLSPDQLGACPESLTRSAAPNGTEHDWLGWLRSEIEVCAWWRCQWECECRHRLPDLFSKLGAGGWWLAYAYSIPERTSISHHPMNFLLQQNCWWWSQNRRWWHTLLYSRTSHRIAPYSLESTACVYTLIFFLDPASEAPAVLCTWSPRAIWIRPTTLGGIMGMFLW